MPRLSVLMPAYNAAATIDRAVRSTLHALPADAELVVLDDGSDDATASVLDRFVDNRVRVLCRSNGGVATALGDLLRATDSEFVARMDADDLCLPRRFHQQLRAVRHADVTFTTVRPWTGSGHPALARPRALTVAEMPFHLLLTNPVAHSTLLARRAVIEGVGGYRVVPSEDYDLWLRLAADGARMRRLALPGLAYRIHAGQVTAVTGWRERSWRDPHTAEAFSALAERVIGRPATRITTLSIEPISAAEKLRRCGAFAAAVRTSAAALSPPARRRVSRRLAEREVWLRRAVGSSDPTDEARLHREPRRVP